MALVFKKKASGNVESPAPKLMVVAEPPKPVFAPDGLVAVPEHPKQKPATAGEHLVFVWPLKSTSPAYYEVEIDGKQTWIGRTSVVSSTVEGDTVHLTVTKAYARRKGWLPKSA